MKPYDVWFEIVGNHQEMRIEHLDIITGSGYAVIDGPFLDQKGPKTVHRYTVERAS